MEKQHKLSAFISRLSAAHLPFSAACQERNNKALELVRLALELNPGHPWSLQPVVDRRFLSTGRSRRRFRKDGINDSCSIAVHSSGERGNSACDQCCIHRWADPDGARVPDIPY